MSKNVKPLLVEPAKSPKKRLGEEPPIGASHRNKRLKRAKAAVVSTSKNALTENKSRKQQRQEPPPLVLSNADKCGPITVHRIYHYRTGYLQPLPRHHEEKKTD